MVDGIPDETEIAEQIKRAKELVLAFSASQVGDHHDFAHQAINDLINELEDPQMLYLVVRMFSAVVAALAMDVHPDSITDAVRREENAIRGIEIALAAIGASNARRNPLA